MTSNSDHPVGDRNLALEAVRVTEAAALAASQFLGGGDERAADEAAGMAMHKSLSRLAITGTVRISEAHEGESDHLYIGETVGAGGGPDLDVAVLPLEGKSIVARGGPNALSLIAVTEKGGFLELPSIYMDKIAVGPGLPDGVVDLDQTPAENIAAVAKAKGVAVDEVVVCMLDRPRHGQTIRDIRDVGARIRLILDGDVSGVVSTALPKTGVDIFMGIGNALQGLLAAAAMRGMGGQMQGRLVFRTDDDRLKAHECGIEDMEHKYQAEEMAKGDVTFAATGVTYGPILEPVRRMSAGILVSHSMVVRSKSRTLRYVEAHHDVVHGKDA